MTDNVNANVALYTCGKCGARWRGERTTDPVGCPWCRNYSLVGVTRPPPRSRT
ncbi:MAG: hypothetical protein GX837_06655 [Methanomicrobiales archaeon]|nr:hypothetical protein [Methanomicrobiales archaeon]